MRACARATVYMYACVLARWRVTAQYQCTIILTDLALIWSSRQGPRWLSLTFSGTIYQNPLGNNLYRPPQPLYVAHRNLCSKDRSAAICPPACRDMNITLESCLTPDRLRRGADGDRDPKGIGARRSLALSFTSDIWTPP